MIVDGGDGDVDPFAVSVMCCNERVPFAFPNRQYAEGLKYDDEGVAL